MKVKVKDIMNLTCFKEAKIVAGYKGINREVKSVTVAEVPDAADWLKGGELVITTGYFVKDNTEIQKKWVLDLIKEGACALAIKPDRFLGKTPQLMKQIADEYSFPLIELPYTITWPVILESVMNKISDNQNMIIKRTEEIHNKLTQIVLEGKGISYIANTLSQLVCNIIIVEDVTMESMAVSIGSTRNKRDSGNLEKFLNYRLSPGYKQEFKSNKFYNNVLKSPNKKVYYNIINKKFNNIKQITIPIVADNIIYGFISLVEFFKKANQIDIVALEHGATTIALEMMKQNVAYETEKRIKRNFLNDLLEGRLDNVLSSFDKHSTIDFDITKPSVAIILELEGIEGFVKEDDSIFYQKKDENLHRILESYFNKKESKSFINSDGNIFEILYNFNIDKEKKEILAELKCVCKEISQNILEHYPGTKYYFGVGGLYYNYENIKKSYKEAKKALEIGKLFLGKNQVFLHNELGIYRLLLLIDKATEALEFCNDVLGDLIKHDKENKDNLCYVLEKFLVNNGNLAQTARELYVHPNTLSYRLKKISKILNKDLDDAKVRFNLFFALMLKRFHLNG